MNYNVLRYFSVLAQVEHYTLAAARLGISQPSLSSAIHNLETELGGVKLFEKSGRNIRLTEEGRFYREKVDAALHELDAASLTLKESRHSAPVVIRLGCVSGSLAGTAAKQIADYSKKNNRVRFRITESSAETLMDLVRQEELDMALVDLTDRDRSLHFRKLKEQGFYVVLPKEHPLADRREIEPGEIVDEPQIVFNYDINKSFREWASGVHSEERVQCTVDTAQAALDLVAAGVGITCLPFTCLQQREDLRYVPLTNWHQALYMCILYDKWLEPPVWDFVELLVKSLRDKHNEPIIL